MAEHRARFGELSQLGFRLAAVSVDGPERSRALAAQLELPFPLFCDPSREAVRAFGVFNAREKGGIAYPATFVLDGDRTVRFRSLDRTAQRVDLDALFAFLRGAAPAPPKPRRSTVVPTLGDFFRVTKNAIRGGIRSPEA